MIAALLPIALRVLIGEIFKILFGWLEKRQADAARVALGAAQERVARAAAEAALNKELRDAEDRNRAASDDELRQRLRDSLGRTGPSGIPAV